MDRAYLESMVPFMVSCPTPITPNPPPSKKSLPYPIYIIGTNLDVHVHVFYRVIQVNREKNDAHIVNLFCFTFHDAISEWG
jgi:hypothetical protein